MAKTIFGGDHSALIEVLIAARRDAGLKQSELAARIGRDQSFISLVEGRQRRVDVIEFIKLSQALGREPTELLSRVLSLIKGSNDQ